MASFWPATIRARSGGSPDGGPPRTIHPVTNVLNVLAMRYGYHRLATNVHRMSDLVAWSRSLARRYLDIPQFRMTRWRHVQAVAASATRVSPICGADRDLVIAAAWLHDIGYSPRLVQTGFHPVDGALFLDGLGADSRIVSLVAHHSAAYAEAELRGLTSHYLQWADSEGPATDVLWFADMTTSFTGEPVQFDGRVLDIRRRWGPDHTVTRAIEASAPRLRAAIARTITGAEKHRLRIDIPDVNQDDLASPRSSR